MTEILTESFCERCGTRYTFETVAPRQKKLGGLKTLGRGLKTFVLSDDTSLDEALAGARSDEEREMAGRQLDAFHKTFNFCMNCRQYTCANCWNPIEARCLSCAPRADQVIGDAPLQLATAGGGVATPELEEPAWPFEFDAPEPAVPMLDAADLLGRLDATEAEPAEGWPEHIHEPEPEHVHDIEVEAEHVHAPEPQHDAVAATNGLEPDLEGLLASSAELATANQATPAVEVTEEESPAAALFEAAAEEAAESSAQAAAEAAARAEAEESAALLAAQAAAEASAQAAADAAAEAAALATAQAAAAPPSVEERARDAAAATGALLGRFRPGQNLDAEIAAYEQSLAGERAPAPEPVAAEPIAAEPIAAEPIAAEPVAAEPELETAEPVAEPVIAAEPAPEPVAAAEALEPEAPATRRDIIEQPGWPRPEKPEAAPDVEPAWPVGPRWPTSLPARLEAAPPPPPQAVPPAFPAPAAANPAPAAEVDPLAFLTARRAGEAMWAASAQDVVAAADRPGENIPAAVRSCVSCGLSLSATARFCRRCGTRQGEG